MHYLFSKDKSNNCNNHENGVFLKLKNTVVTNLVTILKMCRVSASKLSTFNVCIPKYILCVAITLSIRVVSEQIQFHANNSLPNSYSVLND
jgi:hypothetical protein